MTHRIDSATGVAAIRTSRHEHRALTAEHDQAGGGGLKREPGWKVNLAGPFDPMAPRGTYLDIVV